MILQRQLDGMTGQPSSEAVLAAAYRKPISLEFRDVPLKTIFEVIARTSGLNFIFDKDVRSDQRATVLLKNSTIEAVVNLLLMTNQLEQRVVDANTVLIYPNTVAKAREYQPLVVRSFQLANGDAKQVANTVKALTKARDVVVDERLNLLMVRDTADIVRLAEKVVALTDAPEPEVMLEVEILEVNRTRLLDLGVQWPDQVGFAPLAATGSGTITLADLQNINRNAIGVTPLQLTVNAGKTDSDANILANPRIRARNKEKAKILIGDRVPNITTTSTSTGFLSESVNYVDVGLKLEVEPTVYLDGEVGIKISLEVSTIVNQIATKSGSIAYQIGTRTASTTLRLKDGENQVLAGLINDEDRRSANKLPGFGDIPVVGRLFGSTSDNTTKTEILLSITPRLVRGLHRPEAWAAEFDAGTESTAKVRGVERMAFPMGEPVRAMPRPVPKPAVGAPPSPVGGPPPSGDVPVPGAGPGPQSNAAPAAAAPMRLALEGPQSLRVGESGTVYLTVQAEAPTQALPVVVRFDPRAVQITEVAEGDFLRRGGIPTNFSYQIDAGGQIFISGNRSGSDGATGAGRVAAIGLRAVSIAAAAIEVARAMPTGPGGVLLATAPTLPLVIRIQ